MRGRYLDASSLIFFVEEIKYPTAYQFFRA